MRRSFLLLFCLILSSTFLSITQAKHAFAGGTATITTVNESGNDDTNAATGTTCPTTSFGKQVGSASHTFDKMALSISSSSGDCQRDYFEFSTSSLPADTSSITQIVFDFNIGSVTNGINCDYMPMVQNGAEPKSLSASALWTEIGDGTPYISNDATCTTTGSKSLTLGSQANTDCYTSFHAGNKWCAIGIMYHSETRGASGIALQINNDFSANVPDIKITYTEGFTASISDTTTNSDAVTRSVVNSRTDGDTTTNADTLTRAVVNTRTDSESTTNADSLTRAVTNSRTDSDSTTSADSLTRAVVNSRADSDSTTNSDSVTRAVVNSRTDADSTTNADSLTRAVTNSRTDADTATTSDSLARQYAASRTDGDASSLTDVLIRAFTGSRAPSDSGTLQDSLNRAVVNSRSPSDSSHNSDSLNRNQTLGRTDGDSTTNTDSLARSAGNVRTPSESTSLADSIMRSQQVKRFVGDVTHSLDSLTRSANMTRAIDDTASLLDQITRKINGLVVHTITIQDDCLVIVDQKTGLCI